MVLLDPLCFLYCWLLVSNKSGETIFLKKLYTLDIFIWLLMEKYGHFMNLIYLKITEPLRQNWNHNYSLHIGGTFNIIHVPFGNYLATIFIQPVNYWLRADNQCSFKQLSLQLHPCQLSYLQLHPSQLMISFQQLHPSQLFSLHLRTYSYPARWKSVYM